MMENAPTTQQFQYDLVDKPTASKLQILASEIGFINRMACFEIGARMKAASEELSQQGKLGAGFKEWVESETPFTKSTAYEFIAIHENLSQHFVRDRGLSDGTNSHLSAFSYASLRQMASPSYPEEARGKLIEAAKAGEKISEKAAKEAKEEVLRAKEEAEQARKEAEQAKKDKEESDAKIAEATARLERAREEYIKLKNRPPERVEIEKIVEKAPPGPYADWDQAWNAIRLKEQDAEKAERKAKAEKEAAERDIGRLKTQLIKERHEAGKERSERSALEAQQIVLTSLRTSIAGFLRNNADNFMQLNPQYLQSSDHEYLARVEEHLREMADKLAEARGVTAEYAEFEVVSA